MKRTVYIGPHSLLCASGGAEELWRDYTSGRSPLKKTVLKGERIELPVVVGAIPESCGLPDPFASDFIERLKLGLMRVIQDLSRQGAGGKFDFLIVGRGRMRALRLDGPKPEMRNEWPGQEMLDWLSATLTANEIFVPQERMLSLETSCVTGLAASRAALRRLQAGMAKRILLISFDLISASRLVSMDALGVLTRQERPRVFDHHRDGFSRAEAVSALVLSDEDERSGPKIALRSVALNSDGGGLTEMESSGARIQACVQECLEEAEVETPSFIKAHGTGTKMNDSIEYGMLERVFSRSKTKIPVVSFKSQFGHCQNASAMLEMILASEVLAQDRLMPVLNSSGFDTDSNIYVQKTPRFGSGLKTCLGIGIGFGGINGAYYLERIS